MTGKPRREAAPAALADKQLTTVCGGPTEELYGNYNFLLEVAGVAPDARPRQFTPPIGNNKGS